MKQSSFLIGVLCVFGLGLAPGCIIKQTSPAQTSPTSVVSLAGTTWSGPDSNGSHYTFHFLPGGQLRYTSPTGTFDKATWRQDGASLYMETNDRYSEYLGTISGTSIKGKASNRVGKSWTWQVTQQAP